MWCCGSIPGLGVPAERELYHPARASAPQPYFFWNKNRPASSGLWGEGWTESLKLGQSQKLPILAPAFSAPTHPPSGSLFSSLQAAPPCPSPGLREFWERKSGLGPPTDAGLEHPLKLQLEEGGPARGGEGTCGSHPPVP